MLGRSIVMIPAKNWETFEAWIERPAAKIAPIEKLAARTPSWER